MHPTESSAGTRTRSVIRYAAIILAAGGLYYLFVSATGLYVPCMFRMITGWKCPGCGVSHLFIHLGHGQVAEAFADNQLLFLLLPFAAVYVVWKIFRYIKTGDRGYSAVENRVFIGVIAAAAVFTVLRNTIL